jgi:hypothetical protein
MPATDRSSMLRTLAWAYTLLIGLRKPGEKRLAAASI